MITNIMDMIVPIPMTLTIGFAAFLMIRPTSKFDFLVICIISTISYCILVTAISKSIRRLQSIEKQ